MNDFDLKHFLNISRVVEGGVSPSSKGVNETRCIMPIWGRRFRILMLFSHMRGPLRDMGVFAPKNGPTLSKTLSCMVPPEVLSKNKFVLEKWILGQKKMLAKNLFAG